MHTNQLEKPINESAFSLQNFEHAQRVAKMLAQSSLIPEVYRGKVENVMIAMEMSNRMNISPLMVMQNLYIVKGNPGWSGQFVIGIINNSKRFASELQFEKSGDGDDYGYAAKTFKQSGNIDKEGTKITMRMVKAEGWLDKPGSKWKTMPEQMFKYRAAAFFGRLHCPDLLMGMQTIEEVVDTIEQKAQDCDDLKTTYLLLLSNLEQITGSIDPKLMPDNWTKEQNSENFLEANAFIRMKIEEEKLIRKGLNTPHTVSEIGEAARNAADRDDYYVDQRKK